MAEPAYAPEFYVRILDDPRHSAVVRITHWINVISFVGLLVSGIAILIAHPRLYWGETGNIETPSLIDLPLPFVLRGQNGWGRYLHFLSAWFSVGNGVVYVISGFLRRHFQQDVLPAKAALNWASLKRLNTHATPTYGIHQRLAYAGVIFLLFPLVIWTGFAMSPAITSVFPSVVTLLNGQQSARTIHFFVAVALVLFLFIHIGMVWLTGFTAQVRAMILGGKKGSV